MSAANPDITACLVDRSLQRILAAVDKVAPHDSPHKVHRAEEIALCFARWKIEVTAARLEALNPPNANRGVSRIGAAKFALAIDHLLNHVGARRVWLHTSWRGTVRLQLRLNPYFSNYVTFRKALAQVRCGGIFSIRWER